MLKPSADKREPQEETNSSGVACDLESWHVCEALVNRQQEACVHARAHTHTSETPGIPLRLRNMRKKPRRRGNA